MSILGAMGFFIIMQFGCLGMLIKTKDSAWQTRNLALAIVVLVLGLSTLLI